MPKFGSGMPREHTSGMKPPSFPEKSPASPGASPMEQPSAPTLAPPAAPKAIKVKSMAGQSARAGSKRINPSLLEKNGL